MGELESPEALGSAPTVESTPNDDLGSAASLLRGVASAPGLRTELLRVGQVVAGRYRIERTIGEGGMGVVYVARDEQLGRDVALKVGSAMSAAALARMEREAQALASLSHPNVVVVYEVGEIEGRVFVAMELVIGGTLAAWLRAKRRTPGEIIAMVCAAGDGLAAAHASGVVHRDIKPDNILVGDDGRPRVADFGLALAGDARNDVTRAGAIVGTPAYMSPEQLAGAEVDARTDQFALCATLWEALFGVRMLSGQPPPTGDTARARTVPPHVEAALRRGLASGVDARWPALDALLAELRRDPGRRRRRVLLGAALAGAMAAAVIIPLALGRRGAAVCEDDDVALAPTWNPTRADALERALGAAAWSPVRPRIEAFTHAWIGAHHDACVAARVDGAQSEAMLARRDLCLTAARAQLDAALTDLAAAKGGLPGGALPGLGACADAATLARQAPLPADAAGRAALERVYADAAALRIAWLRGAANDGPELGDRLLAAARATAWPPLIARAAWVRGELRFPAHADDSRAALQEAASVALSAGADPDAARAMGELAWQLAIARDIGSARSSVELARSIWARTDRDPDIGAYLRGTEAMVGWLGGTHR